MKRRPHDDLHSSISIRRPSGAITVDTDTYPAGPQTQHDRRPHEIAEIIFGVEPVREMIVAAPSRIRTLYIRQGTETKFDQQMQAVRDSGGQVVAVASNELARIAGSEACHQGIIAAVREYRYLPLEHVLARKPDPLLLVDGVTDPRNLGAILRIGECAGISTIVLAKDRTAGLTPAAIKSSAGAWAHLALARCGNVAHTLEWLKDKSYWIAALDPHGDTSLYDLDVTRRLTLVLGSEGHGIREIVRKTADFVVRIPVYGQVSSLNVSVAAAIALFEIAHRRLTSASRNS
ncbi:MAG: 23S rRNA (guanosine(2251)-2'-O)-methyltransferase RlmB [Deltaproteobacteria bacterium]|nr:23S rRNA (guanosine(2251)-2'-O)-methyltransferase RlmB [Deltaproteobacteria bacterium]MBV8452220.1 23S rRNA (guanosine(2251)-2'-O)-methyltransferase RlmB [Deltaproteobacteria bacterium]